MHAIVNAQNTDIMARAHAHRIIIQVVPMYLAEIAPKEHRGKLVSFSMATGTIGALVIICKRDMNHP